jgi:4-amino-4-deoxy-L-arabinose transferase-like glycosyltransferase
MRHRPKREILIVLLILAVASFFRFYHLDKYPPGLYPDEAMNGSNALIANTTGNYQIFYPENFGREGLFINIQALSVKYFGIHSWALRGVSAVFGVLTVLGLYLLAKELFDWQIAAISSFLLAISFWHVNFSRIGFRAIMLPFILVYAFYFLWRGIKRSRLRYFFWAGVFGGLGFYTYTSYRIAPLIAVIIFLSYWAFLKKAYSGPEYEHTRNRFLAGFSLMMIVTFFVALPIGIYFLRNPQNFMMRNDQGVFVQAQPLQTLAQSTVQTLNMFIATGDGNPRHNIPGAPMLAWPIAIFFAIGFLKELHHWLSRKHGHLSPVHTFLFAWFFVMLLPGFLSTEAPHALRTIGVLPIIMIFTARGLWWVFHASEEWEIIHHPWEGRGHNQYLAPVLALFALLAAFAFYEYHRYFEVWGPSQITQGAFAQNYADIAEKINSLPIATRKYVIVTAPGASAYGLPVPAETVMFLTDTATPKTQRAKNLVYLTQDQTRTYHFDPKGVIFRIQ